MIYFQRKNSVKKEIYFFVINNHLLGWEFGLEISNVDFKEMSIILEFVSLNSNLIFLQYCELCFPLYIIF